jgi:hypothetical protein
MCRGFESLHRYQKTTVFMGFPTALRPGGPSVFMPSVQKVSIEMYNLVISDLSRLHSVNDPISWLLGSYAKTLVYPDV